MPRFERVSAPDYSFWSRLLHRLALGNRFAAELSFDIEKATAPKVDRDISVEPHVFVAGLARAGTTILMRELYATGSYRSLTYRDMPFPLAPNYWEKLNRASRRTIEARERAHGDGILVDFDSPEALEEVFWRVFSGVSYIEKERLIPMQADPDVLSDFRQYVSLLLRAHPTKRYLSKNNNNILRLDSLSRCFPNCITIIPFREPAAHAGSLLRQHQLFSDRHRTDSFARDYMKWLGHHEFGSDHRPFVFEDGELSILRQLDPRTDLDYWLTLWTSTYQYLLSKAPENCVFMSYERLCNDTGSVWALLCERLEIADAPVPVSLRPPGKPPTNAANKTLRQARRLYEALSSRGL